jgi:solute carrier family 35 protein E1
MQALEPLFNGLLAAIVFRELFPWFVYASLVPIVAGVALSSVTAVEYQHLGFMLAASSAMLKVVQNIYTKKVMQMRSYTFFEVHLFNGAAAFTVLVPALLLKSLFFGFPAFSGLPFGSMVASVLLQWVASIAGYVVLNLVHHLTFTIANCVKRVVIIFSAIVWFHQPLAWTNVLGVSVAVGGVLAYNLAKDKARRDREVQDTREASKTARFHVYTDVPVRDTLTQPLGDVIAAEANAEGGAAHSRSIMATDTTRRASSFGD